MNVQVAADLGMDESTLLGHLPPALRHLRRPGGRRHDQAVLVDAEGLADRRAALLDDVQFATRLPKLRSWCPVNMIDRHRDEVEAEARTAGGQ